MYLIKNILTLLLLVFTCLSAAYSQDSPSIPQRTAEQEALKQTEKLKQELLLTPEQARIIYEINLRYERQRQISNTRSEAMERIKNKNAEIERILTPEQKNALYNKRFERSAYENSGRNRSQALMSTSLRQNGTYTTHTNVRVLTSDIYLKSNKQRRSTRYSGNADKTSNPAPSSQPATQGSNNTTPTTDQKSKTDKATSTPGKTNTSR